jgi:predicted PurR-regulated permease PerM
MVQSHSRPPPHQVALVILAACVVGVCAFVLSPFIAPIVWAAIIAYVTWPAYSTLCRLLGNRRSLAALAMTALAGGALLIPLLWLAVTLRHEGLRALGVLRDYLSSGPLHLPETLRQLPGAESLDGWLAAHTGDSKSLEDDFLRWSGSRSRDLLAIAGGVGRNIVQAAFCLLTLFFFYRDAKALVAQVRSVSQRLLGAGADRYFTTVRAMVRAVMFGVLLTAFAQGLIAGLGFRLLGVEPYVLLGTLTAFASFLPVVGTLAVTGPVAAVLFLSGRHWQGVAMLLWAILLVHPIDNLLRPLVVSSVTRMPYLLAMFGVLGGLLAFGLAGVFIGPIALAVGLAVWQELATPSAQAPKPDQ